MTDLQLYALAAFILGLLARSPLDRAWRWLRWEVPHARWFPLRCWRCRRWFQRANVTCCEHRIAGWVWLCGPCRDAIYRVSDHLGRAR